MNKEKLLIILLIAFIDLSCNSNKAFYNLGEVVMDSEMEIINITMIGNRPFCKVILLDKTYNFLIDTGAPTAISEHVFNALSLKISHEGSMSDSQKNKRTEKFVILPELKLDNLVFKNIGSSILNFDIPEIKCLGFDGIIGSNLMAKLFWKFDYSNNKIIVTKNLDNFKVNDFDFSVRFKHKRQKTPFVKGKVGNKKISFMLDTGYFGNISVLNNYDYYKASSAEDKFITKSGSTSIGIYGGGSEKKAFTMKTNLYLDKQLFENELIESESYSLIGGKFLRDYEFVVDWVNLKIYFKRNNNTKIKNLKGFGFFYRFKNGKPIVSSKIESKDVPINLGDEILEINQINFTTLDSFDFCKYYLKEIIKEESEIYITVKRLNDTLKFNLKEQEFIK